MRKGIMEIQIYEYGENQLGYLVGETEESIIKTVEVTEEQLEEIKKVTLEQMNTILLTLI